MLYSLAYCETYMVLAQVFRRYKVELVDWKYGISLTEYWNSTNGNGRDDDFSVCADRFVPVYKGQTKATMKHREE